MYNKLMFTYSRYCLRHGSNNVELKCNVNQSKGKISRQCTNDLMITKNVLYSIVLHHHYFY